MPKVHNARQVDPIPDDAVYVGRPTPFGNPYSHLNASMADIKVNTREEAIAMYKKWFERRLRNPEFNAKVEALRGKDLICWCAPHSCHADVILEYLERTDNGA